MRYTRESQAVFEDIVGEPVYVRCRILVKIDVKAEVASLLYDDISLLPDNLMAKYCCYAYRTNYNVTDASVNSYFLFLPIWHPCASSGL